MPNIAKRISPTLVTATALQRGGGISSGKAHASAPAQNESCSGMDPRRLHSERPPNKSPLAAKAIGLDRLAALNVFMRAGAPKYDVLNEPHGHIQDVFNEYGVQIMSPHFVLQPAAPVVVPKDSWRAPPA